jgi:uncharacterized membrane protein
MKITKSKSVLLVALLILIALLVMLWILPYFFKPVNLPASIGPGYGAGTVPARVVEIIEEGEIQLGDVLQPYQVLRVKILEGEYKGLPMEIDYGKRQIRQEGISFSPGDEILITIGKRADGVITAYFVDKMRIKPLLWLLTTFVVSIIVIARWKGVRALLAMVFSLLVIIGYIIPHILSGEDPVKVSIIGSAVLLGVTLYVTYGWNLKTHSSVVSMVISLVITGALTWFFVGLTHLTGFGSEDALYLLQVQDVSINLRGLMLGGMIIGAVGVLDDLVTTQSSAVFELHGTDPGQGSSGLFRRSMRIGQDHVAATVNTLVLAYAGASLPMLLVFTLARGQLSYLVNFEIIAVEIVRALVGSLGLIFAVPIASGIASWMVLNAHRFGEFRKILGPENSDTHGHSH